MSISDPITSADDRIDIRDVIGRMSWLSCDRTDDPHDDDPLTGSWDDPDQRAEWLTLHELMKEVTSTIDDDPRNGIVLVPERQWVDYVQEWYGDTYGGDIAFAGDRHSYPEWKAQSWDSVLSRPPFDRIDWPAVAEDMRRDRAEFEWEGVTFIQG